jgi:hypothetical protein
MQQRCGRNRSAASTATSNAAIAAVAIRSAASGPPMMRGIRIELHHKTPPRTCYLEYVECSVMGEREPAVVYVAEGSLDALRTSVLSGHAEVHPGHPLGITNYKSSLGDWGLLLFGYSIRGHTLEEFAGMVAAAQAELVSAPREIPRCAAPADRDYPRFGVSRR